MTDELDQLVSAISEAGSEPEMPDQDILSLESEVTANLTTAFVMLDVAKLDFSLTDEEYYILSALLELSSGAKEVILFDGQIVQSGNFNEILRLLKIFHYISRMNATFPGEICAPIYKYSNIIEIQVKKAEPAKVEKPPAKYTAPLKPINEGGSRYRTSERKLPPRPTFNSVVQSHEQPVDNVISDGRGVWVNGKYFPLGEF